MIITAKVLKTKNESQADLSLSVSKAKTFDECKAKFKYCYIEKLPRKEWEHHKLGKFLHEVLEQFHIARLANHDLPIDDLFKFYHSLLDKYSLNDESRIEALNIVKSYKGRLIDQIASDKEAKVLGLEKSFNIDIDNKILLNGFIDRVQIDYDGIIHVADYKTTKDKKYLKNDYFQLLTYSFALMLEDPSLKKIRASYIMLRHKCDYMTKEFVRDEVMEVEAKFIKYAEDIYAEKIWRANPKPLCKYCDYLDVCDDGKLYMHNFNKKRALKNSGANNVKFGLTDW